jgi:hypothetical protein
MPIYTAVNAAAAATALGELEDEWGGRYPARFTFLLGHDDGEHLFGTGET